jgi:hypothetical protein
MPAAEAAYAHFGRNNVLGFFSIAADYING